MTVGTSADEIKRKRVLDNQMLIIEKAIWPRETQIEKDFDQPAGKVNFKVSTLGFGIY